MAAFKASFEALNESPSFTKTDCISDFEIINELQSSFFLIKC